jgi:hypothetical protein
MQEDHEEVPSKGGSTRDSSVHLTIAERTDAAMCDISSLAYSETQSVSDMVPYSPPGVGVRDVVRCSCTFTFPAYCVFDVTCDFLHVRLCLFIYV